MAIMVVVMVVLAVSVVVVVLLVLMVMMVMMLVIMVMVVVMVVMLVLVMMLVVVMVVVMMPITVDDDTSKNQKKVSTLNMILQIVASELKDPIFHSNECHIGSFSSEATKHKQY